MMLGVISAEAIKFARHRATWGLVWLWPIGIALIYLLSIGVELAGGEGEDSAEATAAGWVSEGAEFWGVPAHVFGRYLIGAFVAVMFAGEYGWNTWKLVVPHRARAALIGAKYVMAFVLLALGFTLGAVVFNGLGWVEDLVTGDPIPAGITFAAMLEAHAAGALRALFPVLLTIAYVSLAAILTRSTVGALVIGLVVTTLEQLFTTFGPRLEHYAPSLVNFLYEVLPGYHVANLGDWIIEGKALEVPFQAGTYSASLGTSLATVAAWTGALVGLTFWAFRRQDIN